MSAPEPHEAVVGRRGRWTWDRPAGESFGPRAHPERCSDEFPSAWAGRFERQVVLRLTLTMIGVWGLFAVAAGSAYLLLRWLRVACWITGCSS